MRKRASFTRVLLALALVAAAVAAIGWPRTAGEFKSFEGRIEIDFDRPSRSRVAFMVAAKFRGRKLRDLG